VRTFRQALELNAHVRKGERGSTVDARWIPVSARRRFRSSQRGSLSRAGG